MTANTNNEALAARLSILHVSLSIGETNVTYNEHCLPMADERNIAICTLFKVAMPVPSSMKLFDGDGTVPGFVRLLRETLREHDFDVIHCHSPHVSFLLLLATLDRRELLRKSVVTVHDSYNNFKLRNRLLFLPVFSQFSRIVSCSRASFASFPQLYRLLAGERFCAVQNGVNISRIDQRRANCSLDKSPEHFKVVAIGRLVPVKNPFTILNAFRDALDNRSYLTYIGDGPLRKALEDNCLTEHLSQQVTFTGLIPRDQVFERVSSSDLFISTSWGEGLPVAVLEAMACGIPVLLSDIPPHREIACNANFIPLVRPNDHAGFAREIARFREMSADQRSNIGRQCRETVEKKFSLASMHAQYERIYRDLSRGTASSVRLAPGGAHAS